MNIRWAFFWFFLGVWSTIEAYLGYQSYLENAQNSAMALWIVFLGSWSLLGLVTIPAIWLVFTHLFKGGLEDAHDTSI